MALTPKKREKAAIKAKWRVFINNGFSNNGLNSFPKCTANIDQTGYL
jgi:hypothetical protein